MKIIMSDSVSSEEDFSVGLSLSETECDRHLF